MREGWTYQWDQFEQNDANRRFLAFAAVQLNVPEGTVIFQGVNESPAEANAHKKQARSGQEENGGASDRNLNWRHPRTNIWTKGQNRAEVFSIQSQQ